MWQSNSCPRISNCIDPQIDAGLRPVRITRPCA